MYRFAWRHSTSSPGFLEGAIYALTNPCNNKGVQKKQYSPEEVFYDIGGIDLCPEYASIKIARALSLLPVEVVDFVVGNYVFISPDKTEEGSCLPFDHVFFKGKKGLIFFPRDLWEENFVRIAFTVAHEAAHAFKGHSIPTFEDTEAKKRMRAEVEADKTAIKWLKGRFDEKSLLKICNYYKKNKTSQF